jgi:GTPase SAR1 family protein
VGGPGTWFRPRRWRRKKYRISLIGAERSGKTTLISAWRQDWRGDEIDPGRTQAPKPYGPIKLTVDGTRITIVNLADVPGVRDAWCTWKEGVESSNYVLYLIDATVLPDPGQTPGEDWFRLVDDAGLLHDWVAEGGADLCVIAITHTDQDKRAEKMSPEDYRRYVRRLVEPIVLRIGPSVQVVTGKLKTEADALALTSLVMGHITSWNPTRR